MLYCRDKPGIEPARYDVNGGSTSIGDPYGMTGTRMVGHAMIEGKRRGARYVVVSMCVGGRDGRSRFVRSCLTERAFARRMNGVAAPLMRALHTVPGMLAEHEPPGELFVLRSTGFALEPARRSVGPCVATRGLTRRNLPGEYGAKSRPASPP